MILTDNLMKAVCIAILCASRQEMASSLVISQYFSRVPDLLVLPPRFETIPKTVVPLSIPLKTTIISVLNNFYECSKVFTGTCFGSMAKSSSVVLW